MSEIRTRDSVLADIAGVCRDLHHLAGYALRKAREWNQANPGQAIHPDDVADLMNVQRMLETYDETD